MPTTQVLVRIHSPRDEQAVSKSLKLFNLPHSTVSGKQDTQWLDDLTAEVQQPHGATFLVVSADSKSAVQEALDHSKVLTDILGAR